MVSGLWVFPPYWGIHPIPLSIPPSLCCIALKGVQWESRCSRAVRTGDIVSQILDIRSGFPIQGLDLLLGITSLGSIFQVPKQLVRPSTHHALHISHY